jgi:hypothetical protein
MAQEYLSHSQRLGPLAFGTLAAGVVAALLAFCAAFLALCLNGAISMRHTKKISKGRTCIMMALIWSLVGRLSCVAAVIVFIRSVLMMSNFKRSNQD